MKTVITSIRMESRPLSYMARIRTESYWWLAEFYAVPPNAESIRRMREVLNTVSQEEADPVAASLYKFLNVLEGGAVDEIVDRLLPEHTRLLGGLHPAYGPPPPYESVYRGGQFMGEVTLSVIKAFEDAGFEQIDISVGPPDHIASELKFMAALCYKEREAWGREDTDAALGWIQHEQRFLDEHILQWVPALCDAVRSNTKEPYFVCLSDLAKEACISDRKAVTQLLSELFRAQREEEVK